MRRVPLAVPVAWPEPERLRWSSGAASSGTPTTVCVMGLVT